MSNYKLTFQLKQHTPLIHFQADQQGATLRVSELKPKLDKFLIEKFKKNGIKIHDNWWVGKGDHPALDYKVRIDADPDKPIQIPRSAKGSLKVPTFFANMGNEYLGNEKHLCFSKLPIAVTILSFNTDLMKLITLDRLQEFFLCTNFGSRQSKGFGFFSISNQSIKTETFDLWFDVDFKKQFGSRSTQVKVEEFHLKVFEMIEIFYKSLRSGINQKNENGSAFYIKPAIFLYAMVKLRKQWDKKSIKQQYYNQDQLKKEREDHPDASILTFTDQDHTHIMIKDVFGLSSAERWGNGQLEKTHTSIERFQSPLLFKPIELENGVYRIGIISTEIPPEFLNQVFDIKFGGRKGLKLKTPSQFKWADFWTFYFSEGFPSLEDRIDDSITNFKGTNEYNVLKNIAQTIQSKYKSKTA